MDPITKFFLETGAGIIKDGYENSKKSPAQRAAEERENQGCVPGCSIISCNGCTIIFSIIAFLLFISYCSEANKVCGIIGFPRKTFLRDSKILRLLFLTV